MATSDGQVNLSLTTTGGEQVTAALQKMKADVANLGKEATQSFSGVSDSFVLTQKGIGDLQARLDETARRLKAVNDVATSESEKFVASIEAEKYALEGKARALKDPATLSAIKYNSELRTEIDAMTRSINGEVTEYEKLERTLQDSIIKMRAQKEALADPVFVQSLKEQARLKHEINEATNKALGITPKHVNEIDKETNSILSNSRARREVLVMMHEMAQGRFKNLASSMMVFGEYSNSNWMEKLTGLITPMNLAIAGTTVAVAGVAHAMWNASEASAEMWHHMEQLGKAEGVSAQTMMGFQYMTVGTGISTEQLGNAFARFTQHLGANSEKMRELGITAREPLPAFEQLMEIIKNTPDASERARIANAALGEEWRRFIPILEQGKSGAEAAIEAMRIPPGVAEEYERANKAQIEIDKSWMAIKLHAGEAFAGIRADFKEAEASLAHFAEYASKLKIPAWVVAMVQTSRGVMTGDLIGVFQGAMKIKNLSTPNDEAPETSQSQSSSSYAAYMASRHKELTDKEKDLQRESLGVISRNDLAVALAEEKKNYSAHRALVMGEHKSAKELDSSHYQLLEQLSRAHQIRMKEIRDQFARKNKPKAEKVSRVGADLDTMYAENESGEYKMFRPMDQSSREAALKRQHAQDLQARRERELMQKGFADDWNRTRNQEFELQKRRENDAIEAAKKELAIRKEIGDTLAADILTVAHGQQSIAKMGEAALERVEQYALSAAIAWAVPAALANAATLGGASEAASSSIFSLVDLAKSAVGIPHARGGMVFGTSLKQPEESWTPIQPSRINPISNTTNNYGGAIHFTISGAGDPRAVAREVAKILPRATMMASGNRNGTSR